MRRAFTLVELLIVVVILGVLAAVAIPKFQDSKRKAAVASLTTELRHRVAELELHYATYGSYEGGLPTPSSTEGVAFGVGATATGYTLWGMDGRWPEMMYCVVLGGTNGGQTVGFADGSQVQMEAGVVGGPECR
jgi:prepilin-type N-terminal cleavage/methylation domain-containing protein